VPLNLVVRQAVTLEKKGANTSASSRSSSRSPASSSPMAPSVSAPLTESGTVFLHLLDKGKPSHRSSHEGFEIRLVWVVNTRALRVMRASIVRKDPLRNPTRHMLAGYD
jgi:hypothetical protein